MALKNNCPTLKKVADNEPIFVLRAQDASAPATIREWVKLNPQLLAEKRDEALACAAQMESWPGRRPAD